MPIIANFPTGDSAYQRAAEAGFPGTEDEFYEQLAQANNLVTVLSGGNITMDETIGAGPYAIEFTEESDGSLTPDDIGAAKKDLSNVPAGAVTAEKLADDVTGETIRVQNDKETTLADALAPLGGATTAQAALAALGAGVRPNLLDNAIFVGGGLNGKLPVNQRAKIEYSNGYGIDRWRSVYGNTMEILQDGVKFQYVDNNYVAWQVLSNQLSYGNTITVSALLTNGILLTASGTLSPELDDIGTPAYNEYSVHYALSSNHLNITGFDSSKYITIQAIKLELGENQTLAYQDADGVWHLLPQPESDYTTQLAQCRIYFIRCNNVASIAGVAYSQTEFVFTVPIPEMRTVPAISNVSCNGIVTKSGIIIPASALSFSVLRIGASGCVIRIDSTQNAEVGPAVLLDFSADFTAEL